MKPEAMIVHNGKAQEALRIARRIGYSKERSCALREIASALALSGDPHQHIFEEALHAARNISVKQAEAIVFNELQLAMGTVGQRSSYFSRTSLFGAAMGSVRSVGVEWARSNALTDIGLALFRAEAPFQHVFQEATQCARTIRHPIGRAIALKQIAASLSDANEPCQEVLLECLGAANSMEATMTPEPVLRELACLLAKAGDTRQALRIIEGVSSPIETSMALLEISSILAEKGEPCQHLLTDALLTSGRIRDPAARVTALNQIALIRARTDESYRYLLEDALQLAMGISSSTERRKALHDVALATAGTGDFERALEVAGDIDNGLERATALLGIGMSLFREGHPSKHVLTEAWLACRTIDYPVKGSKVLRDVAAGFHQTGQPCANVLNDALRLARDIQLDTLERARALSRTASALVHTGQSCSSVFEEALQVTRRIHPDDRQDRVIMLCEIGAGLACSGESYQPTFDEALQVSESMRDALERSIAFREVSIALVRASSGLPSDFSPAESHS